MKRLGLFVYRWFITTSCILVVKEFAVITVSDFGLSILYSMVMMAIVFSVMED